MATLAQAIYEFLSIPESEQPASFYRLLGVSPTETNAEVIENAANRQMMFVRNNARGQYYTVSQELLNELSEAKRCLLCPERRRAYDAMLAAIAAKGAAPSGPVLDESMVYHVSAREPNDAKPSPDDRPTSWVIGAGKECDIVIDDPYVSRKHCRIICDGGQYWIEDLQSCNGTYVNADRVVARKLVSLTDSIGLGKTIRLAWGDFLQLRKSQPTTKERRPLIVTIPRRSLARAEGLEPANPARPTAYSPGTDLTVNGN